MSEDRVIALSVHLSMDEWAAMLSVLRDHSESLVDWDFTTRTFYEEIVHKLERAPFPEDKER